MCPPAHFQPFADAFIVGSTPNADVHKDIHPPHIRGSPLARIHTRHALKHTHWTTQTSISAHTNTHVCIHTRAHQQAMHTHTQARARARHMPVLFSRQARQPGGWPGVVAAAGRPSAAGGAVLRPGAAAVPAAREVTPRRPDGYTPTALRFRRLSPVVPDPRHGWAGGPLAQRPPCPAAPTEPLRRTVLRGTSLGQRGFPNRRSETSFLLPTLNFCCFGVNEIRGFSHPWETRTHELCIFFFISHNYDTIRA